MELTGGDESKGEGGRRKWWLAGLLLAVCQTLRSGVDTGSRVELCGADWVLKMRGKTEQEGRWGDEWIGS